MSNLFTLQYWFNPRPAPFIPVVDHALVTLFGGLLIVAVILKIMTMRMGWDKMMKKNVKRIAVAFFWLSLLGWTLYALVSQRIYGLGMRIGFVFWFALLAWYAWSFWKYYFVSLPTSQKMAEEREKVEKWLPGKKEY
ncbi:MAG: hypothetical protein NUV81_01255 [bacterium]|nr:hypothetical protein [bacterium]